MSKAITQEVKELVMRGIGENDEWASDVKDAALGLIRRALQAERREIGRLIEAALQRTNKDNELFEELLSSVTARKLVFYGEAL